MASPRAVGAELNGRRFIGRWGQVRRSGRGAENSPNFNSMPGREGKRGWEVWGKGGWGGGGAENSPNSKHWFTTYGDSRSNPKEAERLPESEVPSVKCVDRSMVEKIGVRAMTR